MNRTKKATTVFVEIISILYIIYDSVFSAAVKTQSAALQLEDSTVMYSLGSAWAANPKISTALISMAILGFILSTYLIIFKFKEPQQ